jgi:DNA-binding LytR/AlgR family response regulator
MSPDNIMAYSADVPLFIKDRKKWVRLRVEHVEWLEAADNCTIIHTHQEDHIVGRTLKQVIDELGETGFERIHRSYAVNLEKIDTIDDGGIRIAGTLLPIGRKYRQTLLARLHMI